MFTGETNFVFSQIADIEENTKLNVNGSTLKWWLDTDKELLTTLLHSGNGSSEQLLREFHDWITSLADMKNIYLWGNGILFDNKMIQHQFELIGLKYPIYYKNDRDVRTILEIASLKTGLTEKKIKDMFTNPSEKKHDALDDVKYQVRLVSGCYRLIIEKP